MKENKLNIFVEIAIFAAIGFVLDFLQGSISKAFPVFVSGGSIGIAMIPVLIMSYRRGLWPGVMCGLLLSILQILQGPSIINGTNYDNAFLRVFMPFLQVMLDYILAYTVVGFAGVFAKKFNTGKKQYLWLVLGTVLGGTLKFLCHFGSGFFWTPAGGAEFVGTHFVALAYNIIYNGAYMLPNIIICSILLVLVNKFQPSLLNPNYKKGEINSEE